MPKPTQISIRKRSDRHANCVDPVVGAILSGWRYDISGIPADLRGDYEAHLEACQHCRNRQRLHRTVDVLLLSATTLCFAAFVLAALVMHKLEAFSHVTAVHVPLHPATSRVPELAHIPSSVTIGLEAVAIAGMVVSMLLWVLVSMATPVTGIVTSALKEHVWKKAA